MNKHAVYHILDTPYSYAKDLNTLSVILRVAKNDIKMCKIHYKTRYDWENSFFVKDMEIVDTNELFDYFKAEISIERNRYRYFFELIDNSGNKEFFDERGFRNEFIKRAEATAFQYPYIAEPDTYKSINWLKGSVVYQIFVERFCNGDESNDPKDALKWGSEVSITSKFGGDIQGIINNLDYLNELGINLIYLTPIFKSSSNHKYNTGDYYEVEPQFGSRNKVKELIDKCHEKNIKVVFDAVFNHSGADFFAFKDILEKQEKSKYIDWYFIDDFPVSYEEGNYYTFADNVKNMPKFNTANKETREYLLKVAEYWINEIDIDGWRLDVCDEVDHSFWREFKQRVKKQKKDAIIVGEIMHEASSFLRGDQLDSIMNYPFKGAMVDFFAKRTIGVEEFDNILSRSRVIYMDEINKQMWNLIGSHDTQRFLTECDDKIERMKLAIVFQFTYIGVPYIYYGDEVGLNGGEEPQSRKCMVWEKEKQNKDLLEFYKKIIKLRKNNYELIYGNYKTIYSKDNIIAFERNYNKEKIIIIINNNYEERVVDLNLSLKCINLMALKEEIITDKIIIKPMDFKILRKED